LQLAEGPFRMCIGTTERAQYFLSCVDGFHRDRDRRLEFPPGRDKLTRE
jgi:hypothetical protein